MPTILIVAASPLDQDRLRLGAEVRDIRHSLQRSRNRENWAIESNEAATVDDLRRALLDFRPTILHFAGHGGGVGGLCFEDQHGNTNTADTQPLSKLLHHFKDDLKCVVLNACYSDVQADAIRSEIDHVVGMRAAVNDEAAAKFAVAFYDAVFAGTDFRTAFDLGCTALDLNKLPDSDVPVFMTGAHLEVTDLSYSARVPEIERVLYTYFNTPYGDRAALTTTGASLSETMVRHYGEQMRRNVEKVQVLSMSAVSDEQWRVAVDVLAGQDRHQVTFYIRIRDRTTLVEWEATVGLWSVPVKTYRALGTDVPIIARVIAELDDYYNYDFSDKQHRFQSVRLRTLDRETLHGYVNRHKPVYHDLMALLSDGNSHAVTLAIGNASGETSTPLIHELLSPTWLYDPPNEDAEPSVATEATS
ncbi:CHAT domain-containing protein [Rubinisphaera brasiliensis]|uniref:CHAT domain-containing protein n=1 Tax=Rubinisphaera brasiliensis (strain ATCC 49424 / DSM 5305 / JCM 21570 / IAM 15109 / NBRC 103401 / IFAM 1448) TaxID=756272 RepID=F0SND6_RUBBR|nr:CHAT domain-containing protein [Rubinisphaera brasiliensis]ADY62179.1 hypothetical protein Plabr_4608 [Rubinisphaera brasiliensis DSM 5305]